MADSKEPTKVAATTEHQIAVHWKEEEYYKPSPAFVAQANQIGRASCRERV